MTHKPYPKNVPGDFYVEEGCCTRCEIPFSVAKNLFSMGEHGHCYVSKQPADGREMHQMIQAFEV